MNYSSVLVITYGRSGSTLLQGLLNSIEGCVVRGENYNLCVGLFASYRSLKAASSRFGVKRHARWPTFPWFGADRLDVELFLENARTLVRNQLLPPGEAAETVRCYGFKEIRYLPDQLDSRSQVKLEDYLDFLSELFPRPAFIFLTREHAQVLKSGWWKTKDAPRIERFLQGFDATVDAYGKDKRWTFHITYDEIVSKSPRLKAMFDFLGASYELATIESVLAKKHSIGLNPATKAKNRNYRIELEASPLVAHIDFDRSPIKIIGDETFALGGVVVLNNRADGSYSLLANDAAGTHRPTWGKRSPVLRAKFPGNPAALNARFSAVGLRISDEKPLTLSLVSQSGEAHVLARVRLDQDGDEDPFDANEP